MSDCETRCVRDLKFREVGYIADGHFYVDDEQNWWLRGDTEVNTESNTHSDVEVRMLLDSVVVDRVQVSATRVNIGRPAGTTFPVKVVWAEGETNAQEA